MEPKQSTNEMSFGEACFFFVVGVIAIVFCTAIAILGIVGLVKLLVWYTLKCWWFWS